MATFSKLPLSHNTNGKNIKVTQTATAGDDIPTAVAGTSNWDEVWLYACNTDSSDRLVQLIIAYCTENTTAYEKIVLLLFECDWIENG